MSSLYTLWLVALAIAGTALLIMLALLFGRLVLGWNKRTREAERQRIIPLLLSADSQGWLERRRDLAAEVAVELIQLVRGSDRDRFIQTAARIGVPARLRQQLKAGPPRQRLAAAEALAEFGDDRSVNRLHEALRDRNADVRLTAALSLAALGEAPPARELVERLGIGTSENSLLSISLFRDIAAGDPDDVKGLVLDPTIPAGAKAAAIDALSASGDYSLVPVIATLAATADAHDPALPRYLRALGDFGHPAAEAAVRKRLGSPLYEVRAAAAEAAGRIGLTSLAPQLKALLGDPEWWVRFRAGEALARLGQTGARLLHDTAETGSPLARTAAALTMAERGIA